ncbi:MAG: ribosome assembly cofactor RimP [Saprospiraceae bacterium]|nr:ribosome assembly cofactor RimP [Saprospiraceae bacterium]
MINREKIIELIEAKTKDSDLFVVDVLINKPNNIVVLMDGDNGINIQSCVDISRLIELNFDRDVEDYKLDISSFGLDKPLKLKRQYNKCVGRQLSIIDKDNIEHSGTLIELNENELRLELNLSKKQIKENTENTKVLKFDNIKETKVIITF